MASHEGWEALVAALARGLYENARDGHNGDLGPYDAWPHAIPFDRDEFSLMAAEKLEAHDAEVAVRAQEVKFHCQTHMCGHCGGCKAAGIRDENSALQAEVERLHEHADELATGWDEARAQLAAVKVIADKHIPLYCCCGGACPGPGLRAALSSVDPAAHDAEAVESQSASARQAAADAFVVDPVCRERNPGLDEWHGNCCRFPKSCSPHIRADLLEKRAEAVDHE